MFALQSLGTVQNSIRMLLLNIPYDESFCDFISSVLICRIPCRNSTDLIAERCGQRDRSVRIILKSILPEGHNVFLKAHTSV